MCSLKYHFLMDLAHPSQLLFFELHNFSVPHLYFLSITVCISEPKLSVHYHSCLDIRSLVSSLFLTVCLNVCLSLNDCNSLFLLSVS